MAVNLLKYFNYSYTVSLVDKNVNCGNTRTPLNPIQYITFIINDKTHSIYSSKIPFDRNPKVYSPFHSGIF